MSGTTYTYKFDDFHVNDADILPPAAGRQNVVFGTAMITSGFSYALTMTLHDSSSPQKQIATWRMDSTSGFTSKWLGMAPITGCTYPLVASGTIETTSSKLDLMKGIQCQMGTKPGDLSPLCIERKLFGNDQGSDGDWNDIVISLQVYSNSTD